MRRFRRRRTEALRHLGTLALKNLNHHARQSFSILNILIVKLSSLGDVVHTMPAVQDIRRALPDAQIDWVVEPGFAPLVQRCEGVHRVIPCALRQWRKTWWQASTRAAWKAFRADLARTRYDAVIDCQGLTKSALIARCAQLTPTGKRYALANRTDGSGYEAPTRWLADVAVPVPAHIAAVQRARLQCALALGYGLKPTDTTLEGQNLEYFGLVTQVNPAQAAMQTIAFIHGTSRADKCWSEAHWVQLGQRLLAQGYSIGLLHGSAEEEQRSQRLAQALRSDHAMQAVNADNSVQAVSVGNTEQNSAQVQVWPRLPLDALTDRLAQCAGAIGVDSGLSHIAVALDLPHVQLYNFDTAWRTGPQGRPRQRSVVGHPEPTVDAVWDAWLAVSTAAAPSNAGKLALHNAQDSLSHSTADALKTKATDA
jgi:heptosyltransferase I